MYVKPPSKSWVGTKLDPDLKIVGAATLNDLVLEADATMWF
jgi:predicted peroxiredoxin